jgi:hypothetical protein
MIPKDNLATITNDLSSVHLSLAVDALYESRVKKPYNKHAISAILHGYCALESAINFLGYEMFFNEDSNRFVSLKERDLPLRKMIKAWNSSLPCLDKIEYILSVYKAELPTDLKNKLFELNNLRNWLAHGFLYKTTFLLEPNSEGEHSYNVIDSEDDIDWKSKFQNTKFNSIAHIDSSDAEKAIRIILQIMLIISKSCNQPFSFLGCREKINYKILHGDTVIEDIINPK